MYINICVCLCTCSRVCALFSSATFGFVISSTNQGSGENNSELSSHCTQDRLALIFLRISVRTTNPCIKIQIYRGWCSNAFKFLHYSRTKETLKIFSSDCQKSQLKTQSFRVYQVFKHNMWALNICSNILKIGTQKVILSCKFLMKITMFISI